MHGALLALLLSSLSCRVCLCPIWGGMAQDPLVKETALTMASLFFQPDLSQHQLPTGMACSVRADELKQSAVCAEAHVVVIALSLLLQCWPHRF